MMGRLEAQENLFYRFRIEDHVSQDHLLRQIDWLLDFDAIRAELAALYSHTGRPSVDPELMLRMLLIGYLYGIRSERRLVEEIHLNLAYRWFCKLGLEGRVPDRSTFSKNRHGRFADGDVLRRLFESVVEKCIDFGIVGGHGRGHRRQHHRGGCQPGSQGRAGRGSENLVVEGSGAAPGRRLFG